MNCRSGRSSTRGKSSSQKTDTILFWAKRSQTSKTGEKNDDEKGEEENETRPTSNVQFKNRMEKKELNRRMHTYTQSTARHGTAKPHTRTYRSIANKCSIFELKIQQRTTDVAFISFCFVLCCVVASLLLCTCRDM